MAEILNLKTDKNSLPQSPTELEKVRLTFSIKVSVKENEVPTEKNSSRKSIFATKASYISN